MVQLISYVYLLFAFCIAWQSKKKNNKTYYCVWVLFINHLFNIKYTPTLYFCFCILWGHFYGDWYFDVYLFIYNIHRITFSTIFILKQINLQYLVLHIYIHNWSLQPFSQDYDLASQYIIVFWFNWNYP